eukprot:CAMPEP_0203717114 /NCGR_PEP_ID=MMETSP0092-20131115/1697_1 /ASSEMBLY_ACC=CAM_ASM_001090 /TAXON_ID=426623 /ORGANISM="Chaetoceros affinis, Strain CCMP159" /LENGTH=437 /DNA_ID=CAMNT_0050595877 /DNA_START=52 /DNA_END=1365 /DNA_ORIENTATION=-
MTTENTVTQGGEQLLRSGRPNPKHISQLKQKPASPKLTASASASSSATSGKKRRNNNGQSFYGNPVLRKAPQAPRRFKSSYILFFMAKQDEIKQVLPKGASVGDVSKRSSQLWKALSAEERAYWNERAEQDKLRYLKEKNEYTGPWQVPYKRAKKNPLAPKRPMSSFLFFSKERRKAIKDKHPNMKNTEISSILGEQWRNATEEERRPHIEMEQRERLKYRVALEKFNREEEARKKKEAEELAEAKLVVTAAKNINRSPSPSPPSPVALNMNTDTNSALSNYSAMAGQQMGQQQQEPYHPAPFAASPVQLNISNNTNSSSSISGSNIAIANAMHFEQQLQQSYQQNYPSSLYMPRSNYNTMAAPLAPTAHSSEPQYLFHQQHQNYDRQEQPQPQPQPSPINVNAEARQPSPSVGLDAAFENPFFFDHEHDSFNAALQ